MSHFFDYIDYCFFNDTATTEIYPYVHTLSRPDSLPISPLPVERIAILAYELGLWSDPLIADVPVRLPEPYVNADWSQPGGSAAHAMYHLSLSATPHRVWSADIGEGSGDVAQILAHPIVVGDPVYTMHSGSLVSAVAAHSGPRRWQVYHPVTDEDPG